MSDIQKKLSELYGKPLDYKFTEDELELIKNHSDISEAKAKYFIWKQKRHNEKYVGFMLDFNPYRIRKTGLDNSTDIICTRDLSEIEKTEEANNWGIKCRTRILTVLNYKHIEALIEDDKKYDIETPEKFVKHCKRLGYSNPNYQYSEQLNLF